MDGSLFEVFRNGLLTPEAAANYKPTTDGDAASELLPKHRFLLETLGPGAPDRNIRSTEFLWRSASSSSMTTLFDN